MATETFALSRPTKTHNGELEKLTLREPTAGAFIEYGEPFTLKARKGQDGEPDSFEFVFDNNKALLRFLADMIVEKGVDDILLKSISASDFRLLRIIAANIILVGVQDKNFTAPSAA
jgi:hypothetical protein